MRRGSTYVKVEEIREGRRQDWGGADKPPSLACSLPRSLSGRLRLGLAEQSVLAALSQAVSLTPPGQGELLWPVSASLAGVTSGFPPPLQRPMPAPSPAGPCHTRLLSPGWWGRGRLGPRHLHSLPYSKPPTAPWCSQGCGRLPKPLVGLFLEFPPAVVDAGKGKTAEARKTWLEEQGMILKQTFW